MTYANLTGTLVTRTQPARLQHTPLAKKRRGLVLTDEAARHPFRASLPPHVCKLAAQSEEAAEATGENFWKLTAADVRGVVNTYVATTAAVLVFIM